MSHLGCLQCAQCCDLVLVDLSVSHRVREAMNE
jgi:hypothetical protein